MQNGPARDQYFQRRRGTQEFGYHRSCPRYVLEVIEEEQQVSGPQVVLQALLQGPFSGFFQSERAGDGGGEQIRVNERGQRDEADAVGKLARKVLRHPYPRARLADAAGSCQRQQPHVGTAHDLLRSIDFSVPANKGGQLRGQVAGVLDRGSIRPSHHGMDFPRSVVPVRVFFGVYPVALVHSSSPSETVYPSPVGIRFRYQQVATSSQFRALVSRRVRARSALRGSPAFRLPRELFHPANPARWNALAGSRVLRGFRARRTIHRLRWRSSGSRGPATSAATSPPSRAGP